MATPPDVHPTPLTDESIGIEVEYVQAVEVAKVFWEWRHKLMAATFAVVTASVVAFGWLAERYASPLVAAAPLLVAAAMCFVARLMDARVGEALNDT